MVACLRQHLFDAAALAVAIRDAIEWKPDVRCAVRHFPDHEVVDRNLPERTKHETKRNDQRDRAAIDSAAAGAAALYLGQLVNRLSAPTPVRCRSERAI